MKRHKAIESWLREKLASSHTESLLFGIGLVLLAAFVLFVTFWVIYAILCLALDSHAVRLGLSFLVLVLLFVGNATIDRRELAKYSFTTGTSHDKPVTIVVPFVGMGSTINPLAPDSVRSYTRMLLDVLFGGPRLMTAAVRLLGRPRQLAEVDVEGCAAVLAFLARRDGPVPFPEIALAVPEGHDVAAVLAQVQEIEGVRLVTNKQPGLSLFSDLRAELPKPVRRRAGKHKEDQRQADAASETKLMDAPIPLLPEPTAPDAENVPLSFGDADADMKAAENEARRRWPEFVTAFARRQPGQKFAVRIPIRDGQLSESVWLLVLNVENDVVSGKVDNEPVQVRNVKLGSSLRVKREILNDWLYTNGEQLVGGFTIKVLQARQGGE